MTPSSAFALTPSSAFALTPSSAFAMTPSSVFAMTPSWVVRKTWFSVGFPAVRMDLPKTFLKVIVDPEYIKFLFFIKLILHGGVDYSSTFVTLCMYASF